MIVLLSYTTRTTHTTRGNIQKAIKDAPSEEILWQRIAEQECYTELVEIILAAITDLSDTCDLSKGHKAHVEKINRMIEFMQDKGVKPGCKTLTRETVFSDFLTAGNDTETMNSARDIMNTKMPGGEFIKQWRNKHDDEIKAKTKSKQRELLEKAVGRIPHTIQGSKGHRNKLNYFHGLQHHRNINIPKGTANHRI